MGHVGDKTVQSWNEFVAKSDLNFEYIGYVPTSEQLAVRIKNRNDYA